MLYDYWFNLGQKIEDRLQLINSSIKLSIKVEYLPKIKGFLFAIRLFTSKNNLYHCTPLVFARVRRAWFKRLLFT